MTSLNRKLPAAALLLLCGCVTVPEGPSVMALPLAMAGELLGMW